MRRPRGPNLTTAALASAKLPILTVSIHPSILPNLLATWRRLSSMVTAAHLWPPISVSFKMIVMVHRSMKSLIRTDPPAQVGDWTATQVMRVLDRLE